MRVAPNRAGTIRQASESCGFVDEAPTAAERLARWHAGIVAFLPVVNHEGFQSERSAVWAIHGQVPEGWIAAEPAAA